MRELCFPLFVSRWNRLHLPLVAASSLLECQGSPRWPGLCSTFLGVGAALLRAFTSAPSCSQLWSPSTHTLHQKTSSL